MGLKLLRKRGYLIKQAPGHFVPFVSVNDPPSAAARDVCGSGAEVQGQPSGTEGGSSEPHPVHPLRSLKPRCVRSIFGRCCFVVLTPPLPEDSS